jgi:hypothetical protein
MTTYEETKAKVQAVKASQKREARKVRVAKFDCMATFPLTASTHKLKYSRIHGGFI